MLVKITDYQQLLNYKNTESKYSIEICIQIFCNTNTKNEIIEMIDKIMTLKNIIRLTLAHISNEFLNELNFNCFASLPNIEYIAISNKLNSFIYENTQIIACNKFKNIQINNECHTITFLNISEGYQKEDIDEFIKYMFYLPSSLKTFLVAFRYCTYSSDESTLTKELEFIELINNLPVSLELIKIILMKKR